MVTRADRKSPFPRVKVLGFAVHAIDLKTAVTRLTTVFTAKEQQRLRVVTLNPEMLMEGINNLELGAALRDAEFVVPDGIGIVWALRKAGFREQQRVTGVDLVETLLAQELGSGLRLYLLGGEPGVAETAAANLQGRWPGHQVVGTAHGYFLPAEDEKIVAAINQTQPDLLLVGMGVPRQEIWLYNHWRNLTVPVGIGVGGLLDLWAGRTKRAPLFLRSIGLEWAYRVWREPARWRRLRVLPTFLKMVRAEQRSKKEGRGRRN